MYISIKKINNMTPQENAKNIIKTFDYNSPDQINLEDIALSESILLDEEKMTNFLGKIQFGDGVAMIKINSSIKEEGQKRFTLAHELGHYFNEIGLRQNRFYQCVINDFNVNTTNLYEKKANQFASELLMPTDWFRKFTHQRQINTDLIKETANHFKTSVTSTAIKYVDYGATPIALVLTKDFKVQWSWINKSFPYQWLPVGYKVRNESMVYDFYKKGETVEYDDLVPAHCWFSEDKTIDSRTSINEQNIYFKNYKSVLTILWK